MLTTFRAAKALLVAIEQVVAEFGAARCELYGVRADFWRALDRFADAAESADNAEALSEAVAVAHQWLGSPDDYERGSAHGLALARLYRAHNELREILNYTEEMLKCS
jgi:hypothetical protein